MGEFFGYGQHSDSHPMRPWWRFDRKEGWWRRSDGDVCGELAIEAWDRENPLPCPPPRCGEVWVWPEDASSQQHNELGSHALITNIDEDGVYAGMECVAFGVNDWPPPGAVLVAGPGSPWMDTREVE